MGTTKLQVTQLPKTSTMIIKQRGDPYFFVSSYNTIIVDVQQLAFLITFLVKNGYLSEKVLEGILSEVKE